MICPTCRSLLRALLVSAAAAVANVSSASILWDWTAGGGAHTGTFTTDGSAAAPLAAGDYTITDVTLLTSSFMPLGSYPFPIAFGGTAPPYVIRWDGSAPTNIDASTDTGVNGLFAGVGRDVLALFGADRGGQDGANYYEFSDESTRESGGDLSLTPRLTPDVPEPTSVLAWGFLATAATAACRVRGGGP